MTAETPSAKERERARAQRQERVRPAPVERACDALDVMWLGSAGPGNDTALWSLGSPAAGRLQSASAEACRASMGGCRAARPSSSVADASSAVPDLGSGVGDDGLADVLERVWDVVSDTITNALSNMEFDGTVD